MDCQHQHMFSKTRLEQVFVSRGLYLLAILRLTILWLSPSILLNLGPLNMSPVDRDEFLLGFIREISDRFPR